MNEDDERRYVLLGLETDVRNKESAVTLAQARLRESFAKASGIYVPSRFQASVGGLIDALREFMTAMEAVETYKEQVLGIRRSELRVPSVPDAVRLGRETQDDGRGAGAASIEG